MPFQSIAQNLHSDAPPFSFALAKLQGHSNAFYCQIRKTFILVTNKAIFNAVYRLFANVKTDHAIEVPGDEQAGHHSHRTP